MYLKPRVMFWDWYWSWHFIVVLKIRIFSRKVVLQRYCLRISIHEITHVNLKLAVKMKPLQLCTLIHNFWSFFLCIFLLITFWCFTYMNIQNIFPPISDNNSFLFKISFLICILAVFNQIASNSLWPRVVSRPLL